MFNLPANKVFVPNDRKGQPYGFCVNPECLESGEQRFEFPIENGDVVCPKCGADRTPMIGLLVVTHLLVRDKAGPVVGNGGLKFRIACDTTGKRTHLATITNQEAATGDYRSCNCMPCLQAATVRNELTVSGYEMSIINKGA